MNEKVVILDGDFATGLEAGGFKIQGDPLWSARLIHTNPQAIKEAHCRFLSSGADVICTATSQASVEGFMKFLGLSSEQTVQLLMSGVYRAKEAAQEFHQTCRDPERKMLLVAASVGPYGAFLHDGSEYTGAYEETMHLQDFKAWHWQQILRLVSA
ncbi:homocysteine S-methyltransferase 1-like isoform X2 [Polyodon spathula]|uniref:homocysteine S-methyltransferase 1-like isoform X2 n=1 Tax=Polyodon spathula TaxID=7913 RepID=UPI001B7E2BA1|nr:homocysteine S-methyltransferase 1-like isoform X2 [Polyodon spathula]